MRVLHVAPSIARSYGGPTQSLLGYAIAARRIGIDVSIAAPAPESPAQEAEAFGELTEGASLQLFRSYGNGAFATSPSLVRWAGRNGKRYDVVHIHGLFNPISSLAARSCVRAGATVIIRPFGTLSRYTFSHRRTALKRVYFRVLERGNLSRADGIHFTTTQERDEAEWRGLNFDQRAYIVPPPFIQGEASIPRHDSDHTPPVVLFLGRVNPVKNVEALIDAWPNVRDLVPDAKLVIAGAGERRYVAALTQRTEWLGIAAGVDFAGIVSGADKQRLLSSASVVVLPSFHENFGIVVLEAVAAGIPVIVSPDVQLAPFLREFGLGKVVSPQPALLADAIAHALNDSALSHRVQTSGSEIVANNFSPEVVGRLLLEMYGGALSHSTRKSRQPAS